MKYKSKSLGTHVTFRYSGWDRCFNLFPYCVIRSNPLREDWKDFSIELGWLIWAAGFRIDSRIKD